MAKKTLAEAIGRIRSAPQSPAAPRAADLARALAQSRPSMIADVSAQTVPKVDLDLPHLSTPIRVSLPLAREEGFAEAPPLPRPTELEIASPERLGLLIRHIRESRNLSQQAFADLAGVGRRFVSELENGKPTLELGKVLKVAQAAGLSLFARSRG